MSSVDCEWVASSDAPIDTDTSIGIGCIFMILVQYGKLVNFDTDSDT